MTYSHGRVTDFPSVLEFDSVAQETEGKSKKRSSKDDSKSNTAAVSEAGRITVDTVAHDSED